MLLNRVWMIGKKAPALAAFVLDHWRVLQMLGEGGIAAAITREPVGQQMGPGRDIVFEEGAELGTRRGRQHRDAGVAGEEPVLALHGMPVFSLLVLRRRHLLDGGDDQALVRVGGAASATCRIAPAANEGLIRLEEAAQRTGRILAQPVAQLVRHGPGRLVRHRQFALQKFGRDAALVAAHQIGGNKPLREIRPRPMQHRSGGDRFPAGGRPYIHRPAAAPSAARPAARRTRHRQIRRASEARPGARCTAPPSQTAPRIPVAQPSDPPLPTGAMLPGARPTTRTFSEPALTDQRIYLIPIAAGFRPFPHNLLLHFSNLLSLYPPCLTIRCYTDLRKFLERSVLFDLMPHSRCQL